MTSKVALITGAARRVGAEIATSLHQAGYNVVIHYHHSTQEAETLATELNSFRAHSASLLSADIRDVRNANNIIQESYQGWQRLDLLVNNASTFYPTPIGEVTEDQWDELQASNVKGAFFLAQAAFPYLCQTEGSIINIIDTNAQKPLKNYSAYCIAKAGLAMATKAMAKEMAPKVRVNGVAPGAVAWPEHENELTEASKLKIIEAIPLKRTGSPKNIASTVLFLANNDYITGQVIAVDGGRSIA